MGSLTGLNLWGITWGFMPDLCDDSDRATDVWDIPYMMNRSLSRYKSMGSTSVGIIRLATLQMCRKSDSVTEYCTQLLKLMMACEVTSSYWAFHINSQPQFIYHVTNIWCRYIRARYIAKLIRIVALEQDNILMQVELVLSARTSNIPGVQYFY